MFYGLEKVGNWLTLSGRVGKWIKKSGKCREFHVFERKSVIFDHRQN